jgi:hypothetical protein
MIFWAVWIAVLTHDALCCQQHAKNSTVLPYLSAFTDMVVLLVRCNHFGLLC